MTIHVRVLLASAALGFGLVVPAAEAQSELRLTGSVFISEAGLFATTVQITSIANQRVRVTLTGFKDDDKLTIEAAALDAATVPDGLRLVARGPVTMSAGSPERQMTADDLEITVSRDGKAVLRAARVTVSR